MLRIARQFTDAFAQHVLVEIQISGSLRYCNTPILHQPHASSWNLRLNFLLSIPDPQFR